MTEAKSPREIAEYDAVKGDAPDRWSRLQAENAELRRLLYTAGVVEIGARNPNVASYCDHWERRAEKAESYAAERERLLVSLDELIVRRLHRLSGSGPQFEHDCTLINGVHLRQTVRRSRPATEGKGDD